MEYKHSSGIHLAENELSVNRAQKRIQLKVSILVFILALLAIISATLAWFTLNTFSSIDDLEMTIGTGAELFISDKNHGTDLSLYGKTITNEMVNEQLAKYNTSLAEIKLDPVTSSNGRVFYSEEGGDRTENTGGFLEFDVYLIATEDMWIHLTSDDTENNAKNGTLVSTNSSAPMSNVTRAVRISFTGDGESAKIYEPNSGSPVGGQTTFDLPEPMRYTDNTRLFKINSMEPYKTTIRIWIEGEDPECINNIRDSHLSVRLCFKGTNDNNESIG